MLARQNDDDWRAQFRMSRATFHALEAQLAPALQREGTIFGAGLTVGQQLATCLMFLARGSYYGAVAAAMNSSKATVMRCVHDVCSAIENIMLDQIAFPRSQAAMQRMAAGFYSRAVRRGGQHGLPLVIGAIDGTHVPIKNPVAGDPTYINRKKFTSVVVQATCDYMGRFIDVYVGKPGRTHDSRAFKESYLYASISGLPDAPDSQLGRDMWQWGVTVGGTHVPYCLVADSAYACEPSILPAFKDTVAQANRDRVAFNTQHSRTRSVIESGFGRLKTRWRLLLRQNELVNLDNMNTVILACFILHNICEAAGEAPPPAPDELLAELNMHEAEGQELGLHRHQYNRVDLERAAADDIDQNMIQAYAAALQRLPPAAVPMPRMPAAHTRTEAGNNIRNTVVACIANGQDQNAHH
jgi:hypothetical protein